MDNIWIIFDNIWIIIMNHLMHNIKNIYHTNYIKNLIKKYIINFIYYSIIF